MARERAASTSIIWLTRRDTRVALTVRGGGWRGAGVIMRAR